MQHRAEAIVEVEERNVGKPHPNLLKYADQLWKNVEMKKQSVVKNREIQNLKRELKELRQRVGLLEEGQEWSDDHIRRLK